MTAKSEAPGDAKCRASPSHRLNSSAPLGVGVSATQVVDHYLRILIDGKVPTVVRSNLIRFMDYTDGTPLVYRPWGLLPAGAMKTSKVRSVVHLIMSMPEYHIN